MTVFLGVLRVLHLLLVGYTLWLSFPLKPENVPRIQLSLPLILAGHGLIKQSLSASGALAAFLVGYAMVSSPLRVWGITLVAFYLIGSQATKYGKKRKATLEAGYHASGYGHRSGWQVLSNSFAALVACCAWNVLFVPGGMHGRLYDRLFERNSPHWRTLFGGGPEMSLSAVCPVDRDAGAGWSRVCILAALGHFACCLGDTLASELGILASSAPRLITTFKPVPPGTNGAISIGGTLASLIGGAVMGLVTAASLVLDRASCSNHIVDLVLWGMLAGVGGSAVDSLLGATVQRTRYDEKQKLIMIDETPGGKAINGLDLLTNNQVNVLSSTLSAVVIGVFA